MRDIVGPRRQVESSIAVKIGNADIVKIELLGNRLGRQPLLYLGRRVEGVNGQAKSLDESKVERNILANPKGIDDRIRYDHRRIQEVAAVVGTNFLHLAVNLRTRRRKPPFRIHAKKCAELAVEPHPDTTLGQSGVHAASLDLRRGSSLVLTQNMADPRANRYQIDVG